MYVCDFSLQVHVLFCLYVYRKCKLTKQIMSSINFIFRQLQGLKKTL